MCKRHFLFILCPAPSPGAAKQTAKAEVQHKQEVRSTQSSTSNYNFGNRTKSLRDVDGTLPKSRLFPIAVVRAKSNLPLAWSSSVWVIFFPGCSHSVDRFVMLSLHSTPSRSFFRLVPRLPYPRPSVGASIWWGYHAETSGR